MHRRVAAGPFEGPKNLALARTCSACPLSRRERRKADGGRFTRQDKVCSRRIVPQTTSWMKGKLTLTWPSPRSNKLRPASNELNGEPSPDK